MDLSARFKILLTQIKLVGKSGVLENLSNKEGKGASGPPVDCDVFAPLDDGLNSLIIDNAFLKCLNDWNS